MFRAKSPGCALAMNEQITPLWLDEMTFDLASVVRDIEQKAQFIVRKEVREDAADVVAEVALSVRPTSELIGAQASSRSGRSIPASFAVTTISFRNSVPI